MAPKQPTKAGKSPSKPREPKESELKKQLLFLWACHKASDVQIDIAAVARHFGIKNNAARLRVARMKKRLDEMATSTKSDGQDQDEDHDKAQTKKTDEINTEDDDDSMDEILPDSD
ncbi:hypothetical protein N7491_002950 [Penicillium cf. griseofulvum]|uniref:Myb-like DNA-binding domain-containing protein n=1 Tax=Penicillium cf. griseofulvum TaxID=2972120 RepID=A0A9W9T1X7_9EURO|nr:hypothetical protein N7472_002881 [Penicillium cf. griseofulvum]KAJ5440544.1 hypothetical protein N7491_002950 [Penicillium cf. griseofulvum]KAJ5448591.1 hypothetical protein N7445_003412 [Penicillium cf. griseofulvum]